MFFVFGSQESVKYQFIFTNYSVCSNRHRTTSACCFGKFAFCSSGYNTGCDVKLCKNFVEIFIFKSAYNCQSSLAGGWNKISWTKILGDSILESEALESGD